MMVARILSTMRTWRIEPERRKGRTNVWAGNSSRHLFRGVLQMRGSCHRLNLHGIIRVRRTRSERISLQLKENHRGKYRYPATE